MQCVSFFTGDGKKTAKKQIYLPAIIRIFVCHAILVVVVELTWPGCMSRPSDDRHCRHAGGLAVRYRSSRNIFTTPHRHVTYRKSSYLPLSSLCYVNDYNSHTVLHEKRHSQ